MKSIKIAGLCLVAMLAVSMVAAVSASATPHWLVCSEGPENVLPTKYTEHQCKVAAASNAGKWEWSELKSTEAVRTQGTLKLEDEISGTNVEVICSGADKGTIGPGGKGTITELSSIKCEKGANCGTLDKSAEPRNLPWQTELYESERGKIREAIKSHAEGTEKPGWKVECTVGGLKKPDECTSEYGNAAAENKATPSLLVLITFSTPNVPKALCSATGKETGDVLGTIAFLLENEWGLRVSS